MPARYRGRPYITSSRRGGGGVKGLMTSDDVGGEGGVLGCDDVINIFELAVILMASTVTITHLTQLVTVDPLTLLFVVGSMIRPLPSVMHLTFRHCWN
jgi:hypothetical protein